MFKILPQGNIWAGYALGAALGDRIFPQPAILAPKKKTALALRDQFETLL